MLRGFALGVFGTALILASIVLIFMTFGGNPLLGVIGIVFLLWGGYCLYVSQHTVRTTD
jgi:hypothetical protein